MWWWGTGDNSCFTVCTWVIVSSSKTDFTTVVSIGTGDNSCFTAALLKHVCTKGHVNTLEEELAAFYRAVLPYRQLCYSTTTALLNCCCTGGSACGISGPYCLYRQLLYSNTTAFLNCCCTAALLEHILQGCTPYIDHCFTRLQQYCCFTQIHILL